MESGDAGIRWRAGRKKGRSRLGLCLPRRRRSRRSRGRGVRRVREPAGHYMRVIRSAAWPVLAHGAVGPAAWWSSARMDAVQGAWGRAERPRRCSSTAEAPMRPYAGGTCGRHVARGDIGSLLDSTYPASKLQNSKKCQLSWKSPKSKVVKGVICFDQPFARERRPKLQFFHGSSYCSQHSQLDFWPICTPNWNVYQLQKKCVPGNNKQPLYWLILNFYSEIWRTHKKTISALKEI
jgi:hypothetical protein